MNQTNRQPATPTPALKPYQMLNAEGQPVSAIRYVEGQPLNIRFNGQSGRFSRDGASPRETLDIGPGLTLTPVAWRFFEGTLFNRPPARYAELFYVDSNRNLAVVLFTNAAADNLKKFAADLKYSPDGPRTLTNTRVRIDAAVRIRKEGGQRYHVAEFTDEGPASVKAITAFRLFALDHRIYRAATRPTPENTCRIEREFWSTTYCTMISTGVMAAAPADDCEEHQIQTHYPC